MAGLRVVCRDRDGGGKENKRSLLNTSQVLPQVGSRKWEALWISRESDRNGDRLVGEGLVVGGGRWDRRIAKMSVPRVGGGQGGVAQVSDFWFKFLFIVLSVMIDHFKITVDSSFANSKTV